MNRSYENFNINLLILHIILGFVLWEFSFLSTYFGLFIILVGTYYILGKPDPFGEYPLFFAAYIVGVEVLLRMTRASLFWEFGKYAIIYFLILGLLRKRCRIYINFYIVLYFLLLLPSIINLPVDSINLWRQSIAFNLSGPACLFMCTIYISNVKISKDKLLNMFLFSILPILTMSIVIICNMPELDTYQFKPYSDSHTSGGYGPNQVSTIFGFGVAILLYSQIMKKSIFSNKYIDIFLLTLFLGLGLITFSRGGILSAIVAMVISISLYFLQGQQKIQIVFKSLSLLIIVLIIWFVIADVTNDVIFKRYGFTNEKYSDRMILDLTGRAKIYKIDIEIFYDHLLTGAGPGQATNLRELYGYGYAVSAHTEYSRMLAEHGILGLLALIILIGTPVYFFFSSAPINKKLIQNLFGILALLTMFHSAMRLSMVSLIYGLLFINYND